MKMQGIKHSLLAVILLAFIYFSGCGSETPAVEHTDCVLWHVELEDANPEYVEDYIYLWDLLENEYPYLSTAERITGKNAEEIKEKYYKRIPLLKTPRDFFYAVVNPCLNEFGGTGHLCAFDDNVFRYHYMLFRNISENTSGGLNPASRYDFEQMTSPQAKVFYKDVIEQAEKDIASGASDVPDDSAYNSSDNLSFKYFPENSAAYVEIRKMNSYSDFDNDEFKALKAFFKDIEATGYKNCIIDIRQNGGGDDSYWMCGVVAPNCAEQMRTENYALFKGNLCNSYLEPVFGKEIQPVDELPLDELPELNRDDLKDITNFVKIQTACPCADDGKPLYTGKFWLLVGENCYSSSESFAMFCKQSGFATLVGTSTGGDGAGCTPMISVLPNTGICIRFSSMLTLNPDGSCNEEFGTTPDYENFGGEDALDKCLSLIGEQK